MWREGGDAGAGGEAGVVGRAGAAGGADVLRRRLHRRHGVVPRILQLHRLLVSCTKNHKQTSSVDPCLLGPF